MLLFHSLLIKKLQNKILDLTREKNQSRKFSDTDPDKTYDWLPRFFFFGRIEDINTTGFFCNKYPQATKKNRGNQSLLKVPILSLGVIYKHGPFI